MDLRGIIAIAGKPGLYKVAAQGRNNIIVQSLETDKKFPAFASDKISSLDDISIYTHEEDIPLSEVYTKLAEKEDYSTSISHNEPTEKLRKYLGEIVPDYNDERVFDSDVKKLFQWYNILVEKGFISKEDAAAEELKASGDKLDAAEKAKTTTANKVAAETMRKTGKTDKPKEKKTENKELEEEKAKPKAKAKAKKSDK